jgi:lysyl-tRNA synthetase class 2
VVEPDAASRPSPVPGGARPDSQRGARLVRGAGFHRGRDARLQVSPGNEAHLHAFATEAIGKSGGATPFFLHTSPEFTAKKLLASGERRIFEMARVWRNRERGPLHHPEFTMLEWYRAEEPYARSWPTVRALLGLAAEAAGAKALTLPRPTRRSLRRRSG